MNRLLAATLALAFAAAPAAPAAAQAPIPEDVQASVRARVDQAGIPGIVVALVDATGARYYSYGSVTPGGAAVNERTVFEIGSITKVFTAVALADMARRGVVTLDDPVQRWLPAGARVPVRGTQPITLRLLSAQRSGLPRMPGNFAPADRNNPYADYTADSMLAFLSRYELPRDPGALYEYSNLGVGLLGYALAQAERTTYEELITRRVLVPLGLRETMITLTPAARARLALGHVSSRPVANWDLSNPVAGAGALRSTAADMTRFLAAAMGLVRTPLDSAFAMTFAPQGAVSPTMDMGLGWHIQQRPTMRIVWHNGGTGGYRSWAGFDPVRKIGALVLTNSNAGADDLGRHLLDTTIALVRVQAALPVSAESLAAYPGRYTLRPGFAFTIWVESAAMFAQLPEQPAFRLWASARDEFFVREVNAQVTFERDSTGRVVALVLHQNGRDQRAPREN